MTSEHIWHGVSTPIIFLRTIGIAAADALRLMEVAKQLDGSVRWRMAQQGVAADAYLVHRFSVGAALEGALPEESQSQPSPLPTSALRDSANSSIPPLASKISLDAHGWHRGRPVCLLGQAVDTSGIDADALAPLIFPDVLEELNKGLHALMQELVGPRILFIMGSWAWEHRLKWATQLLHLVEGGQLVGVVDVKNWQCSVRDGCTVTRMGNASARLMPHSGVFMADGFHTFPLDAALWELAKRCPEPMLQEMLPTRFLTAPLTHRRALQLQEQALGDHCKAILQALDTSSATADELQAQLRLSRPALLRALTGLALVRAIAPPPKSQRSFKPWHAWWARLVGKSQQHPPSTG